MKKEEIKIKLKDCFKNCALGRVQLRKCVVKAMDAGLTKDDILVIANEIPKGISQEEASLCSIIAVGQILRYEKTHTKKKVIKLKDEAKKDILEKLRHCFKKCGLAKKQLRKCIGNALDAGLTKEEVMAITDDIVGGLGEKQVSLCAIIAIEQTLKYEETKRKKPIDIVKEREFERGDF
jgi:galactitol-specific phosphotransferase system IIB component